MKGKIQTPTNPNGTIKDNSVLRMLENSLSDGVLYRFRTDSNEEANVDVILSVLYTYWDSVREVFPDAWERPPKKSRLVHGAGILSMGFLMDAIADRHRSIQRLDKKRIVADLLPMVKVCRWTDGFWEFGPGHQRRWDEIQNTSKDIQMLTNYLLVQYKGLVWNTARN